jgi:putative transposase
LTAAHPGGCPASAARPNLFPTDLWHRRYWEHTIRDERDLENHVNYIHANPVKHGWMEKPQDWPYSTFHRYVRSGLLPEHWMADEVAVLATIGGFD